MSFFVYIWAITCCFWLKTKDVRFIVLAALLAGIISFVKLEGVGYAGLTSMTLLILIFIDKQTEPAQKWRQFGLYFILSGSIALLYPLYSYFVLYKSGAAQAGALAFDLNQVQLSFSIETFERMRTVAKYYLHNLFETNNWNFVWMIFLISLSFLKKKYCSKEFILLFVFVALHFFVYFVGFSFTQYFYWLDSHQALSRSILHVFPIIPTLIVIILHARETNETVSYE